MAILVLSHWTRGLPIPLYQGPACTTVPGASLCNCTKGLHLPLYQGPALQLYQGPAYLTVPRGQPLPLYQGPSCTTLSGTCMSDCTTLSMSKTSIFNVQKLAKSFWFSILIIICMHISLPKLPPRPIHFIICNVWAKVCVCPLCVTFYWRGIETSSQQICKNIPTCQQCWAKSLQNCNLFC